MYNLILWRVVDMVVTVEPRFNQGPSDCENMFAISRFFSIYFTITGAKNIVRYNEDIVT